MGSGSPAPYKVPYRLKNALFKAKTERRLREEAFSKQVHKLADAGIRADILEGNQEMIKPGPDPIKLFSA